MSQPLTLGLALALLLGSWAFSLACGWAARFLQRREYAQRVAASHAHVLTPRNDSKALTLAQQVVNDHEIAKTEREACAVAAEEHSLAAAEAIRKRSN